MEGLEILSLSRNGFESPLPPELVLLSQLSVLDLGAAALTGSFPPEYLTFLALTEMNLSGNRLAGQLPVSGWDGLGALTTLDLSGNQFSGSIPGAIAGAFNLGKTNPKKRENIHGLTIYAIRSSYVHLHVSAEHLDLSKNNGISGVIPFEYLALPNLRFLSLGSNLIIGNIPQDIGFVSTLEHLYLDNTFLEGTLPTELGLLTSLRVLDVS